MALEQWEIELRKHLEGKSIPTTRTKAVKPPAWEEELREEIRDVPDPVLPPKKQPVFVLAMVILFLLGAVLFAYNMKTGCINNWFKAKDKDAEVVARPDVTPPPPPVVKGEDPNLRAMRADIDKLKADQAAMEKRVRWNGDRITLLATVQQENFLTIRNGGNNFIYFNADWTIDRMPQYLELTNEDKDFLNKYIKK